MERSPVSWVALVVSTIWAWVPPVSACAVCFGKTDSPLGKGLHWGVFALLAFIVVMLGAFGAFAVYLVRRSMAMEAGTAAKSDGVDRCSEGSRAEDRGLGDS